MDKLKPILVYKFWILLGLGVLLASAGWFMGTGTMAETIEQRKSTLTALKVAPGSNSPNVHWIADIKSVSDVQAERVVEAGAKLWQVQEDRMEWPQDIQPAMDLLSVGDEIPVVALDLYRSNFEVQKDRLHEIVDPFNKYTGEGEVVFPRELIPLNRPEDWNNFLPTSKEVWDLQEDYWLLKSLLESVRDFNDAFGGNSLRKVRLKQIVALDLFGGGVATGAGGGGPEGGPPEADYGRGRPPEDAYGRPGSEGGLSNFGSRAQSGSRSGADFDAVEEFRQGGSAFGPGADARYTSNAEDVPFKTRGFYLKVIMDHRYVPEFLIELTENPYPVKVVRVHQVDHNGSVYAGTSQQNRGRFSRPSLDSEIGNFQSAFAEPFLADVAIAGDLTIYRQPEPSEEQPAAESEATPEAESPETGEQPQPVSPDQPSETEAPETEPEPGTPVDAPASNSADGEPSPLGLPNATPQASDEKPLADPDLPEPEGQPAAEQPASEESDDAEDLNLQ